MAAVPCGLCEKSVYPMECIRALGKSWHKLCFKCTECHTILGLKNHESYENKIYCKVHLPKLSGTVITDSVSMETAKAAPKAVLESGVHKPSKPSVAAKPGDPAPGGRGRGAAPTRPGRGANSAVATRLAAGVPEKACPVCGNRVYTTEEVKALGNSFHKLCFKCKDCGMALNLKTMQSYEGVLYCKVHLPKLSATVVTDDVNTARALSAPKLNIQHGVVVKDPKAGGGEGPAAATPSDAAAPEAAPEAEPEAAPEEYAEDAAAEPEPEADAVVPEVEAAPEEPEAAVEAEGEVPVEGVEGDAAAEGGTNHGVGRKCQALFEYEVQEEGELGFKEGEVVTITGYPSDDWWTGTTDDGRSGMFPSNYVELLPE